MPGRTETALCESGRATAPPVVRYTHVSGSTSEGYTHTVASTASSNLTPPVQSPHYTPNYSNYNQQRTQASPHYNVNYSPSQSPRPNYSSAIPKPNPSPSSLPSQSPQYTPNFSSSSSHSYSSSFGSSSNSFPAFNNPPSNFDSSGNVTNTKSQHSYENSVFSSEHLSSTLFNIPKTSKTNSVTSPRYTPNCSNFSYFSNNQSKSDSFNDRNSKLKSEFEIPQKLQKSCRDDGEFNYNFGDLQQFLSKHGSKIKNSTEAAQELVTDSLLNFLQRKTYEKGIHDNFPYDTSDINQVVVSICSKNKAEDVDLKKKETTPEDPKLVSDLLSKVASEKEEKRFNEKKRSRKEVLDEVTLDSDEKKTKRDAMSHFQDDKSHHKRSANYTDFNQWDYLNSPEMQTGNSHNRRGHLPFCGTSQSHSMPWNPMGMGMPHQTNPYFSNPHGPVMPAHAHTEYRYNQWNNPNHKNVTNIQNAHSQNSSLPQGKLDMKHHNLTPNKTMMPSQEFSLPINPPAEYSKLRNSPHDMVLRTPPPEIPARPVRPEYAPSSSPVLRNAPPLRTPPPMPGHPKTIISNPLSDLQMLVTNQENDKPAQKSENYQQETVDLSAHSDLAKHKENAEEKERSTISVIKNKMNVGESDVEKPVELTAKASEKSEEKEISSSNQSAVVNNDNLQEKAAEEKKDEESKNTEKETNDNVDEAVNEGSDVQDAVKRQDDDIAKQLELLDGDDKITDVNSNDQNEKKSEDEKKEETESPELTTLTKNGNEVQTSSGNEDDTTKQEIDNENNSEKRKSTDDTDEPEAKKAYIEVETELEKMFEGVNDEKPSEDLPTVSSTSTDVKLTTSDSKKNPKKRPRKVRSVRLSSGQSSCSENQSPRKKAKNVKNDIKKKSRKNLCDVMDSRKGPVLHIEGSRENPTSVIVVNYPKGDDEDEKDKNSAKKLSVASSRSKHHNELDYRGRSRNGLFSSTLSTRYDARTTDHTWICVFCKKGPHYNTLGDLFGPYIISREESGALCDFSGDEKDITDAQKRGGRNKKSLRSSNMVEHFQKMSKKLRRHHSSESCLNGMTAISDDQDDEVRYEVWLHEQCAVWSPNVCLIGSRIMGMQEAIWSSIKTMCSKCGEMGANIGCVHRNCPNRSHYDCARESGWSLEQETFISICHVHKNRS